MEGLEGLADLLRGRNAVDADIALLIGRPATQGHIGEFIAAKVFGIELEAGATHKASDGRFASGPLAGKSVDVKFYGKQEGLLAVAADEQPDFFLVLTGPVSPAASSKGARRPTVIDHVYLFEGRLVAEDIRRRGVQFGVAASLPKELWRNAEIYPDQMNRALPLTAEQRELLAMFSSGPVA